VFDGPVMRPGSTLMRRRHGVVQTRGSTGWQTLIDGLAPHRSMLTEAADLTQAPEAFAVRDHMRSWRFYDGFRADASAPARHPQVGTRTPVLADDGHDLAAAMQTIHEEDPQRLARVIDDAFEG